MKLPAFLRQILSPLASDPAMDDRYFQPVGPMAAAGVTVTPETAMRASAVYRCVKLLADGFGILSLGTYRRLERGRQEIPGHPVTQLFTKKANPYQTAFVFKRMMMGHLALRGNAFARIYRRPGRIELWPLHPDRVKGPELLENGRLRYRYRRPDTNQEEIYIGDLDIFHVMGLSSDGLRGLALSDLARDSIGLTLATEQYGSRLFSQGVRLAGVLQAEGKVDDKARDMISRSFRENWGGQRGAFGVPVLEQGMEFHAMGMTQEDAQFLETRRFEVSDIARWFGIPPHMVGDVERSTSWGTGIEAQGVQFVQYSLLPWLILWEQAIQSAFIPEPDLYARFNVASQLRADSKTRHDIYQIGVQIGMYSPNDCRELEDMNPREGGDVYVTPRSPNEPRTGSDEPPKPPPVEDEEPEPDEEATSETDRDAGSRLRERAQEEAEAAAQRAARGLGSVLLGEERATLALLAVEHAKDDGAWRSAVSSFYGRRCDRVASKTGCESKLAREYCERQRDRVLAGGLKAFEDSGQESVGLLATLTITSAGGRDAAA